MKITRIIDDIDTNKASLISVNPGSAKPVQKMGVESFIESPVIISEDDFPDTEEPTVLLSKDGEVVTGSSLTEIEARLLQINVSAELQAGKIDMVDFPRVITDLEEVPFKLTGYPNVRKEKLLLIAVSRHIEFEAFKQGNGTLRTSFQNLSRMKDEYSTGKIYKTLANSDIDVHVYGIPDWDPTDEMDVCMHGGYNALFRDIWVVIYQPDSPNGQPAAFVAVEREPAMWEGFWTYNSDRVDEIEEFIAYNM